MSKRKPAKKKMAVSPKKRKELKEKKERPDTVICGGNHK